MQRTYAQQCKQCGRHYFWNGHAWQPVHALSFTKTIPAGGLQAGWRIVARRGLRYGWLAARGKV